MTLDDAKVIGLGSLTLLIVFLTIQAIRFDVWAILRRYVVVNMSMPEPVLGDDRTSSRSGSPGSDDLVLGQQHQVEPVEPDDYEPVARQLEREQLIIMLAVQRKESGEYLFSANQITSFVGGAAAPIKATIANVRGKKETPPPAKSLYRPVNGW